MRTVNDRTIGVWRIGRLRTQLAPEELVHFGGGTVQTQSNVGDIGNHSFNTVPTPFYLAKYAGHFVAVGWIFYGCKTGNVDNGSRRSHLFNSISYLGGGVPSKQRKVGIFSEFAMVMLELATNRPAELKVELNSLVAAVVLRLLELLLILLRTRVDGEYAVRKQLLSRFLFWN